MRLTEKALKIALIACIIIIVILGGALGWALMQAAAPPAMVEYPIGLAIAVSGPYAVEGPYRRDAALMAIEEVNAMLERAGSPIRFKPIHEDSKGTAEGAKAALEALAAAGVEVVVGPLSSKEVAAIKSYVDEHHIVAISPSSTAISLAVPDDFIFRMVPTDAAQGRGIADLIWYFGHEHVAVIARDDDYGRGVAGVFESEFTAKGGEVYKIMYDPTAGAYPTEVSDLASKVSEWIGTYGTDKVAVLIVAFDDDGRDIISRALTYTELRQVHWFGSESTRRPTFLPPEAPEEIAQFLMDTNFMNLFPTVGMNPVREKFYENYVTKYGKEPTPYSYFSYDAAWVACLAVLAAGKYDGDAIKAVLPDVCERYIGASGYKKLDENGDVMATDYGIATVALEEGEYIWKEVGIWHFTTREITFYD